MKLKLGLVLPLLLGVHLASAATIVVTSNSGAHNVLGSCVLRDAITQANSGIATGGCGTIAASPAHPAPPDCLCTNNTIVLPTAATITLTELDDAANNTGLPAINASLVITGNGSTIQRDPMRICNRDGATDPGEFALIRNDSSLLVLDHLTLSNGCADSADYQKAKGGAISNFGALVLQNVVLSGNYASNRGGALYSSGYGNGAGANNLSRTILVSNASQSGGGVFIEGSSASLSISASLFVQNSASPYFGGGGLSVGQGSTASVENSTFSQNSAGAASAIAAEGSVAIGNSTFAENTAASGNGAAVQISASGTGQLLTLKNSLFDANSGGAGNCQFGAGQVMLSGANLSSDASCAGFTLNNIDPKLSALADHGGPTQTYALQPGSPAVDAVVDCTDTNGLPLPFDQRGTARPQGAACDIGAFELDDKIFSDGF